MKQFIAFKLIITPAKSALWLAIFYPHVYQTPRSDRHSLYRHSLLGPLDDVVTSSTLFSTSRSKHNGLSLINIFMYPNTTDWHVLIFVYAKTQWKVTYGYFYMSKHNGKSPINIFIYPNTTGCNVLIFLYVQTQRSVTYKYFYVS